ncbi:MAG: type VII secretion target [Gordonia sp. (in: high G+C Gram-positive bacteria)]|uniref:type VII secretion target n=1 Tax=Gordonia TaxID=2053 RepID=UPI0032664568
MNAQAATASDPGRFTSVDPAAAATASHAQSDAAQAVSARVSAERVDTAALTPTFGIIGASFLAALNRVGAARAAELQSVATGHDATADRIRAARAAYDCCDEVGARHLTGVPA